MGENEKLGFSIYFQGQPMCNDVGCITNVPTIEYIGFDTSGKPISQPTTSCGTIPQLSANAALRLESAQADKLTQEILDSSQKPIELLSEETAQRINKAFENIQMTMEKDSPMAFTKRKARKHYKPKFTL